jgi:transketolase
MRNKFADEIYKIGKKDKRIAVLVADISPAGSIERFRQEFPNRFINCGVAEQSMIGIAAGLALKGMRPFCYTIATFALYRPFEMIRVDLCYQNLPVTVIGMGAGLIYSSLGGTHQSFEDIGVARSIPNMQVIAPCDPLEMQYATRWCGVKSKSPVYMRLGKVGEPILTKNAVNKFVFGKLRFLIKNRDSNLVIISYGTIMSIVLKIFEKLKKKNISASVVSFHTLKPLDINGIKKILNTYKNIVIIEEHPFHGSLSSDFKSLANDFGSKANIINFNLKDKFFHFYGSYIELLKKHGISEKKILNKILSII